MLLKFNRVRYRNLLSTGNQWTEIDLSGASKTLVVGPNGAGKSTFLDAISFCLFNKPFRKGLTKNQLINSITKKDCVVETYFEIGSHQYCVVRGLRPSRFEVYKDDEIVDQAAHARDYQEVLEQQVLKVNHKSFCQVVVLGSATFMSFMELPGKHRREVIEDLLDLQIFTAMNTVLKKRADTVADDLKAAEAAGRAAKGKIELTRAHVLELQSRSEAIAKEKRERIAAARENVTASNDAAREVIAKHRTLVAEMVDRDEVKSSIKKLEDTRYKLRAKASEHQGQVDFFTKNTSCPTCTQEIDEDFRASTIERRTKALAVVQDGVGKLEAAYERLQERERAVTAAAREANKLSMEAASINSRVQQQLRYISELEEELARATTTAEADDGAERLAAIELELAKAEADRSELLRARGVCQVVGAMLRDDGIKTRIIRQYVPIINKLVNKYLSSMDFMCQFELDESFNERILSRYRDEFTYASFSEGEKFRIDLALMFAWRAVAKMRNSVNTNLLVLDEVFDGSLDVAGLENFMATIQGLTADTNTFIISHSTDTVSDRFDNVLRFEKRKNFSRIVGA